MTDIQNKHNKKRNTGLLYEFLVRYISKSIIEENDKKTKNALKILTKFFKRETELYKEFRLINSLMKTNVQREQTAVSILQESKKFSKKFDFKKLNREKSLLIREINHTFSDEDFFNQKIKNYKIFATIQTLLNDWRNPTIDNIERTSKYEEEILTRLLEQTEKEKELNEYIVQDVDKLVIKLMMEKLNKKFSEQLNNEQKEIVKNYVFVADDDEKTKINFIDYLKEVQKKSLASINKFLKENEDKILSEKSEKVKNLIENEKLNENVDDKLVERFLKYAKLKEEILNEDKNEIIKRI